MDRIPLSACIITLDEADRIEACIRSLGFCDEVIVVDSGSRDDTMERAQALGARVLQRPFDGYRSQKAFAVAAARHDWVLCLDADERVGPSLQASIEAARKGGFAGHAGYRFARATRYFGRPLRHGNVYPDHVLRLFDRRRGGWNGAREIHEHVTVKGRVGLLTGDLDHDAYRSLSDQLTRMQRYARMMAEHMHQNGRRAGLARLVLSPTWRFTRGYLLRGGFLDGWRGLLHAWVEARYVAHKFVMLWLLERGWRA